jgi:hypothetical protein
MTIATDPYGKFGTKKFDDNYDRNNYGVYRANKIQKQAYRNDLISQDQYGQEYGVTEPILTDFADRLKKTKRVETS